MTYSARPQPTKNTRGYHQDRYESNKIIALATKLGFEITNQDINTSTFQEKTMLLSTEKINIRKRELGKYWNQLPDSKELIEEAYFEQELEIATLLLKIDALSNSEVK